MKLLIVAATWREINPFEQYLLSKDEGGAFRQHAIELLVTGPGSTFTAFHLAKMLPIDNWDLAINLGVCGAFNLDLRPGTVVNVISDCFGDLGAEDDDAFIDISDMGLTDKDAFPFTNGRILSIANNDLEVIKALRKVSAITVNSVSGNDKTIEARKSRFQADVESMEGAAFMYCCLKQSVPFLQLRSVSNYIEKRDKNKWDLDLAIKNLNRAAIDILEELLHKREDENNHP